MPNTPVEQSIWNAVKSILATAQAGTLSYVATDSIFDGQQEAIPSGAFPAIVLEPDRTDEVDHSVPQRIRNTFTINIFVMIEHFDRQKQVVGEGTKRGIIDIVNDVKNVLQADPQLGLSAEGVTDSRFPSTQYEISFNEFPVRIAMMEMTVDYVVTTTGR